MLRDDNQPCTIYTVQFGGNGMARSLRLLSLVAIALFVLVPAAMPRQARGAQTRASTITLTYLRHDNPPINPLEAQYIKQYEAMNPGVTIKMSVVPDADLFTKF